MKSRTLITIGLLGLLLQEKATAQVKQLSLSETFGLVAKGNRNLQVQALENQRSGLAVKESKSQLLPVVNLNGSYTLYTELPVIYLRNENTSEKVGDVKYNGRHAFDGVISAAYPILNKGIQSAIRESGIREQLSHQQTKLLEEQLAITVSQKYLGILLNQEQEKLLLQSLQRNQKALADSRSLFLQGKNLKTDTLSNYIMIQNILSSISILHTSTNVMKLELKQLMGLEDSITIELTDKLENAVAATNDLPGDSLLGFALNNRNDIRSAALQLEQRKEQGLAVKSKYSPQLWLVGQYQLQAQADNLKFWNYSFPRTSFAGIRFSMPIYSGNRQKYQLEQAGMAVSQTEKSIEELKSSVKTELYAANANLQEAWRQLGIQEQNEQAAQINYHMMQERYTHGLGTRLELSDAELSLTKARLGKIQAIYQIRLAEVQLRKATGTLHLQ
ncbi:TolC family protein [Flavihumibacter rivuli]|uniref:TolC family protein n=1 Tax=Flavihumibacter rivuli TaxID=2838156 RepID=UPI001BDECE35|nr:TolC family protein [Flavihumibacter rivuli]ULQ55662.1 TolC family protein [Flavihumibacter rivuli]